MTRPMPFELTDAVLERMLAEQAGPGAPAGLVGGIVAAIETTSQQRTGILPRVGWPDTTQRRSTWLMVGLALLIGLTIGAALIGSVLLRRQTPLASGPLIVYQVHGGYADIYTLDIANGERTALGSIQLNAQLGGQRIRWAADGRHAFVFGDPDRLGAQVDLATHEIAALDIQASDGQQDEVSPAGDRVARLLGDAEKGRSLSVVDLSGTELVNIPLPAGAVASSSIVWAPNGSSILLTGCLPCDQKAIPSPTNHEHLFLVPLDGGPIRQLTDDPTGIFSYSRFSPDGATIAYSTVLCREACTGGIATVGVADGRISRLTTSGADVAPAWSPDGARIAFQRGGDAGGIYVMDRDGGHVMRLTTGPGSGGVDRDRAPIWSPEGSWIAFTRDLSDTSLGDLWVVPSAGGDERLLVPNAVADWGPTATLLALLPSAPATAAPSAPPTAQVEVSASASAAPTEAPAASGPLPLGGGPVLVFQVDGTTRADATTQSVFTVDIGTGKRSKLGSIPLTEATCCPENVQWSADRRSVVLFSVLGLRAIADIGAVAVKATRAEPSGQYKAAISRRGDRVARADQVSGKTDTIVISDLTGHRLTRLSFPMDTHVEEIAWSPDDGSLAVVAQTDPHGDPVTHLFVVPLDGSAVRDLADNGAQVAAAPAHQPRRSQDYGYLGAAWSPDGKTIAIADRACSFETDLMTSNNLHPLDRYACTGRLLTLDATSGAQTVVLQDEGVPGPASWSPDGKRLAFGRFASAGTWDGLPNCYPCEPLGLFVIDRDGGHLTRLADGDGPAAWSPDGTWLVFPRYDWALPEDAFRSEVWVVPADGGQARLIAKHAAAGW